MKYSFDISNFLEEISSLSPSVCFYFFASFIEEGLPVSLLFSGTLYSVGLQSFLFLFSLAFHIFSFLTVCKASSVNHFAFLHFFFFGMGLFTISYTILWTSVHSSSGTLFIGSNPLNLLSLLPYIIISDFIQFHTPPEFSSGVFSAFFNLSLNFTIRSSWSEP